MTETTDCTQLCKCAMASSVFFCWEWLEYQPHAFFSVVLASCDLQLPARGLHVAGDRGCCWLCQALSGYYQCYFHDPCTQTEAVLLFPTVRRDMEAKLYTHESTCRYAGQHLPLCIPHCDQQSPALVLEMKETVYMKDLVELMPQSSIQHR